MDSIDTFKVSYDEEKVGDASKKFEEVKKQIVQVGKQDGNNLSGCITALENPQSALHSVINKILFINQLLNEACLDSSGEVSYARCISKIILSDKEKEIVSFNYNFFKGYLFPARDCIRTPIISIKIDDSSADENFIYFLLDHESHSYQLISKQEIVRRIVSGKLSPGVGVKEEKNVPGMPNITNLDWVVRQRAANKLQKMQNEDIDKEGLLETRGDN